MPFISCPVAEPLGTLVWYQYLNLNAKEFIPSRALFFNGIVSASMSLCSSCQSFLRASLQGRVGKSKQNGLPYQAYTTQGSGDVARQSIRDGCCICYRLLGPQLQNRKPEYTYTYLWIPMKGVLEILASGSYLTVYEEEGN